MGIPYFFEIIGLFLIYLYNLPGYSYSLVLAIYQKQKLPGYRHLFYIPPNMAKPIRVRLIGFAGIVLLITLLVILNRFA